MLGLGRLSGSSGMRPVLVLQGLFTAEQRWCEGSIRKSVGMKGGCAR